MIIDKPTSQVGLCSIVQAAKFLSLSRGKLYQLVNAGEVPCRKFGKSVRVPWSWLHAQADIANGTDSEVAQ